MTESNLLQSSSDLAELRKCRYLHQCPLCQERIDRLEAEIERLGKIEEAARLVIDTEQQVQPDGHFIFEDFAVDDLRSALTSPGDHVWIGIAGHPDDDECSICGEPESLHEESIR